MKAYLHIGADPSGLGGKSATVDTDRRAGKQPIPDPGLKPCPFCGTRAKIQANARKGRMARWYGVCLGERTHTGALMLTDEGARMDWNTRVDA